VHRNPSSLQTHTRHAVGTPEGSAPKPSIYFSAFVPFFLRSPSCHRFAQVNDLMDRPSRSPSDMARTKVSNTCTNCRERHLKCDGGPVCSRCRADGSSCIFIASRRGYRMNARRKAPTTPPQPLGLTPQGPSDTSSKHSSWDSSQFSNHHLTVSPPFRKFTMRHERSGPSGLAAVPLPAE
jgi:hypothetical protein